MMLDAKTDRARGYMLLGIIYMHSLVAFASTRAPEDVMASFVQIKLLAPHVSVFFLLSGMGARRIARRSAFQIARQSAALVLLAIISHLTGFLIQLAVGGAGTGYGDMLLLVEPLFLGTGYSTFVAWFFLSLAMARILTYLFYRNLAVFGAVVVCLAGLVLLAGQIGLPDNIYEWRTWPPAFLFFLIGTRMPANLDIPVPYGLAAGLGSAVLTWFNRPGLLFEGPCLGCDITFVSQPMMGEFGSFPVFIVQEMLFFAFLLSVSQLARPAWITRLPYLFGKHSVQMLLLNGWFLLVFNAFVLPLLPQRESLLLFAGLLVGGALAHRALYVPLKKPIDMMLLMSFRAADLAETWASRLARREPQFKRRIAK